MPRVLLVDDEPNIRLTMAELLRREGYEALTAFDFDSAISVVENNEVDAALVDIVLPRKSGIEILSALHERQPFVPVIMMTGEPNISQIPELVREGAYDFVSKPVVKDTLISIVSKAVEKKRLTDEKRRLEKQIKDYAGQLEVRVADRTRELEEARNFLHTVLDSSTEYAIIAIDTRGRVMLFNHGAELMFGCSEEEAFDKSPGELVASNPYAAESAILKWAREAETEGRRQGEVELRNAAGSSFVASVTITPILTQGRHLLGYLGIIKDLTVERRNEERLRQMSARLAHQEKIAALGRMAAQLAHEIKNPLAGIRLYSLHLKGKIAGKIPAAEETVMDKIIDGINQLSETAEQVLSFARPITVTPRPVDLNRVMTASLALVEPQLSAKKIKVELNLCESGACGTLDEAAMRSTLINLLLNSIQAMSENGELRVSTASGDVGFRVEIADSGCGMTEEQVERVFEPFYTTKNQGLGLGLFFAAQVIEQHGGTIGVNSRVGQGTRITITVPVGGGRADEASGSNPGGR